MKATEIRTAQGNPAVVLDRIAYVHMPHQRSGEMIVACASVRPGETLDETKGGLQRLQEAPTHADFVAYVEEQELHREEKTALGRTDSERVRTRTPWGQADSKTSYGRGINAYSTPGHGGYKVSDALNAAMPDHLRNDDGWYEEDCEWAKVAIAFPDRFTTYERKHAMRTLLSYYPAAWEKVTGGTVVEGMSHTRDQQIFDERHRNDWVVVSASRSDVHDGMVECSATIGGDRSRMRTPECKVFLVPREEYGSGAGFGFVIDPSRHAEFEPEAPAPRF